MSKVWSVVFIVIAIAILATFQNCGGKMQGPNQISNNSQPDQNLTVNGTVKKAELDGCNYLICANDNSDGTTKCFIPKNIDPTLLNDGNVVKVDGTLRSDLVTTCMAGAVLQVNSAQLISGATVPPVSQ